MAVRITELIVRANAGTDKPAAREPSEAERREERARIVEDTVAEVMRLLRRAEEP